MTSLAPKYINIKRGQVVALTVGVFGFAPWKVLDTASNFVRLARARRLRSREQS
jgi:NCS1 family nucleobase:cation symporter-1